MFSYDILLSNLKKLAKSTYWQTIYASSKETSGLHLFKNVDEFTTLQIQFLNELQFYSSIYMDIAMNEVSEKVLDNEIYEDSYYYYKVMKRKREGQQKKTTQDQPIKHNVKGQETLTNKNEWVFTKVKG